MRHRSSHSLQVFWSILTAPFLASRNLYRGCFHTANTAADEAWLHMHCTTRLSQHTYILFLLGLYWASEDANRLAEHMYQTTHFKFVNAQSCFVVDRPIVSVRLYHRPKPTLYESITNPRWNRFGPRPFFPNGISAKLVFFLKWNHFPSIRRNCQAVHIPFSVSSKIYSYIERSNSRNSFQGGRKGWILREACHQHYPSTRDNY